MDKTARAAALMMLILASLLSYVAAEKPETMEAIHVTGKVLCQDCTTGFNEWLKGARPIKGSVVSLACMDGRGRLAYYTRDETDEKGEYDMIVSKVVEAKEIKPRRCSVRLVSSPDDSCNVPTNSGHGVSGVRLLRPSVIYRDLVKYVLDPFYYTTPMCEKPDASNTQY